MGSVLVAVTVGAALFRGAVARWLRGSMLAISRASAMFLVGAGGYLIYYWVVFADAFGLVRRPLNSFQPRPPTGHVWRFGCDCIE